MSVIVWRFCDNRPGHLAQSRGLLQALSERSAVSAFDIPVGRGDGGFRQWLAGRCPHGDALPPPDLLIGAGHATHWHMLAARRRRGGRIVVLMRPSLPLSWFDLCVIPQHDRPPSRANVLTTRGVLNDLSPGGAHDDDRALLVVGGPSRHFRWCNESMLAQIDGLLKRRPELRWQLATSPRTPASLTGVLRARRDTECIPFESAARGWLAAAMAQAGEVWVSQDSMSMIHEALTCGARVGLLSVPYRRGGRVTAAVDRLVTDGLVGAPGDWRQPPLPGQPLDEARRCAQWISQQWLINR